MNLKALLTNAVIQWVVGGGLVATITLVAGAAIRNLPKPEEVKSVWYGWFYRTVQTLFSNPDLKKPA